ncbi:MAG: alpha/beta fold hydrolase [Actinomycetota bacterium]
MTVLFVHGWGFDPGFWQPVAERLPDFGHAFVDLGFHGAPQVPQVERPLVVAHSMGLAWALANLPGPFAGVFAVNAFPRFTRAPDFVEGVAPRLIERMIARFADEPTQVAVDFLRRCGVAEPDLAGADLDRLGSALAWLAVCDERAALAALDCPLQALAGTHDPIVPEPLSRAAFPGASLVLAQGGGHLLPATHPDWVAGQLRAFAARLG